MAVSRLQPSGMHRDPGTRLPSVWGGIHPAQHNASRITLKQWWWRCGTVEAKLKSHSEQAVFVALVGVCHILWYLSWLFAVFMEVQFNKYLSCDPPA